MKQHITVKQLNELTEAQKERLREWWKPSDGDYVLLTNGEKRFIGSLGILDGKKKIILNKGTIFNYEQFSVKECLPLLNIGQCIELLGERIYRIAGPKPEFEILFPGDKQWWVGANTEKRYNDYFNADKLIDALWQAVKEIL